VSLRFPRGLKCETEATAALANGSPAGYGWRLILDGQEIDSGWTAGTKSEARREAWLAAEQSGLVTDGVDS
jgi:hypothetical protein